MQAFLLNTWCVICAFAVLNGCVSTKRHAELDIELSDLYVKAIEHEGEGYFGLGDFGRSGHLSLIRRSSGLFWFSYTKLREMLGPHRAAARLRTIVDQYGLSAVLIAPDSQSWCNNIENAMIDEMIHSSTLRTPYFAMIVGDPPEQKRANDYRNGFIPIDGALVDPKSFLNRGGSHAKTN